jgi:mono/diheme cytochrome c family protein
MGEAMSATQLKLLARQAGKIASTLLICLAVVTVLGQSQEKPSNSVRAGVYSDAQRKRGEGFYKENCARCHSEALTGGENSPALTGDGFIAKWDGLTVGDLFERIRTSMPTDNPGGLGRQQYSDIVAYILSVNGFPPGSKELERETAPLKQIRIEHK